MGYNINMPSHDQELLIFAKLPLISSINPLLNYHYVICINISYTLALFVVGKFYWKSRGLLKQGTLLGFNFIKIILLIFCWLLVSTRHVVHPTNQNRSVYHQNITRVNIVPHPLTTGVVLGRFWWGRRKESQRQKPA